MCLPDLVPTFLHPTSRKEKVTMSEPIKPSQNIYDDEAFFATYAKYPRSQQGLQAATEWPTMRRMVGDLKNRTILDLGSGYGWFCRYAASQGAKKVTGFEISEKMIGRARELDRESEISMRRGEGKEEEDIIEYVQTDLQKFSSVSLQTCSMHVIYSSLTLHYLPTPSLAALLDQIYRVLSNNGTLVFSIEHPIMTAPIDPLTPALGWATAKTVDDSGDEREVKYWPLTDYGQEGERVTDWLTTGIRKYHRRVETYLKMLMERRFILEEFRESWDGMKPDEREAGRPFYLMIKVRRGDF
jgi:SAM-dependent methyltransferase